MFYTNTPFSNFWCADSRNVKPKLNFMVVQSLNWILQFEVYAHSRSLYASMLLSNNGYLGQFFSLHSPQLMVRLGFLIVLS